MFELGSGAGVFLHTAAAHAQSMGMSFGTALLSQHRTSFGQMMTGGRLLLTASAGSAADAISDKAESLSGAAESAAQNVEAAATQSFVKTLEQLGIRTASNGAQTLFSLLGNFFLRLLLAAVVVFIGMRLVRFAGGLFRRFFERFNMTPPVGRFLSSCISALLYMVLVFLAADIVGVNSASIVALLGSAGIAIGLALQGSLSNFAGGVLILMVKPFVIGDYIVCSSGEGTVTSIGIIYTTLLTIDNQKVVLPNAALSNSPLTNMTASARRRVILPVRVSYDADLKHAKDVLRRLLASDDRILKEDGIDVYVDSLGDSAVLLKAAGWTKTDDYWKTKWDLTERIKEEFDREGIEIPFNRMDVRLDSSRRNGTGRTFAAGVSRDRCEQGEQLV